MAGPPKKNQRNLSPNASYPGATAGQEASNLPPELFQAIDTLADTVLLADAQGIVLYANQTMLRQCGYDQEHLVGRPMTAFWAQPNALTQFIMAELAAGRTWRGSIQHKTNGGSFYGETVTISPVTDAHGAVTQLIRTGRKTDDADERLDVPDQIDKRYKSILDIMGDGYMETDLRGNTTFFNKNIPGIYQRNPEEMIGVNYKEYMTPDEAAKIYQIFNEIYRVGHYDRIIDFEALAKDGTPIYCETITTLLHDHHGNPVGFGGVIRDVTEKRRLAALLKESEKKFRMILSAAPDSICLTRLEDGRYIEANEGFYDLTGYTPEETIGRTALDLGIYADPEDRGRFVAALRANGIVDAMEIVTRYKNGTLSCGLWSGRAIEYNGEPCLLVVAKSIDDLKKTQQQLGEREESYRAIIESAPYSINITDASTLRYLVVNDRFCEDTGFTRDEAIGCSAIELGLFKSPQVVQRMGDQLRLEGKVEGMELQVHTKDGRLIHTLCSIIPIHYMGKPCFMSTNVDLTPLKKAQSAQRESEARFRAIFETAADPIFVTDLEDGRFLDANQAACQHLGYPVATLEKMHLKDVIHEQYPYQMPPVSMDGSQPQRVFFESVHISRDGSHIPVEVSSATVMRSGRPALLSIVRDVSERKLAEAELAKYRRHLENMVQERTRELKKAQNELIKQEKLAVLGQLTATVSHELRNPLGVIRFSNFYLNRKIRERDEKVDKHIRRIEEQVSLCDAIVADLLEFTRGRHASPAKQAIEPWLEQVVDQMRESGGIDIKLDIDNALPSVAHDREKMRRVVINLLDNAVLAVRARQETTKKLKAPYQPMVALKVARHGSGLRLQVLDNGCGMDEATRRRAFEPLFTTRARGTGIGLAIVSKIVAEHGGHIELNSAQEKGTTVTIILPHETDPSP